MSVSISYLKRKGMIWHAATDKTTTITTAADSGVPNCLGFLPSAGACIALADLGHGELTILLKESFAQSKQKPRGITYFINCPGLLNAEYLSAMGLDLNQVYVINTATAEAGLWAAEQCCKCPSTARVFVWPSKLSYQQARRLEFNAKKNDVLCVNYLSRRYDADNFPVSLKCEIYCKDNQQHVNILKSRSFSKPRLFSVKVPFCFANRPAHKVSNKRMRVPDASAI